MKNKKRKTRVALIVSLSVVLVIVLASAIYLSDYYKADADKIEAFLPQKTTEAYKNGYIAFGETDSECGFVFYPGGKVEVDSYIPLMRALAERGAFCVLYEMPFNLAVFDVNAADGISEEFPDISKWYIGGHSLGGSMAASHLSKNAEIYEGLVLLGSYSVADLSSFDISVISICGSEDGVMNREKYEKSKANLPSDFTEIIIDGGCHAYFGMYGDQQGDGKASVTAEEQINFTAEKIFEYMSGANG